MAVAISFLFVAIFYAMVGFGGGSSYIAILALTGTNYTTIPVVALICNLIVVTTSCWHFAQSEYFRWTFIWPFVVTSVPMAFVGGLIPITEKTFMSLLGFSLLAAAFKLLLMDRILVASVEEKKPNKLGSLAVGAGLGLLSGMVGIGGGIFLSPLLLLLKWGNPKQIAATAAFFILANSLSGLVGQITKGAVGIELLSFWPLFLAVFVGGQIGSRLSISTKISKRGVVDVTAALVMLVAVRTLIRG